MKQTSQYISGKESKVVRMLDDVGAEEVTYHQMDMLWGSLQEKRPNLSKVALAVLTIPHSRRMQEKSVCFP